MADVKITVGGAFEDEASRRFIEAWHRAERGEAFSEYHGHLRVWMRSPAY